MRAVGLLLAVNKPVRIINFSFFTVNTITATMFKSIEFLCFIIVLLGPLFIGCIKLARWTSITCMGVSLA